MSREDFKEKLRKELLKELGEGYSVRFEHVTKVNHSYEVVNIRKWHETISPVIPIENYYLEFKAGKSIPYIAQNILVFYNEISSPDIKENDLYDYASIKKKIMPRVVNLDRNQSLKDHVPHICLHDLGLMVIFYVDLCTMGETKMSYMIQNQMLKMWNITKDEMISEAVCNSNKDYLYTIKPLEEILFDMTGDKCFLSNDIPDTYIVTDRNTKMFGARILYFCDILRNFAEEQNSDFYIIPSSVHELLLVRTDTELSLQELRDTVFSINREVLDETEFLTDDVFLYLRKLNKVIRVL